MKKLLLSLLSVACLTPLPSLASDLTVTYGNDEWPAVFVASKDTLIKVAVDDEEHINGQVWSEAHDEWSEAERIFTDDGTEFNLEIINEITKLNNGAILLSNGNDLVSYSSTYGFQHFTIPFTEYSMWVSGNKATFVEPCSDESGSPAVALWNEADGFATTTSLSQSSCTSDLSYYSSTKRVLLDYYTGVAYDRSDGLYTAGNTIDLSSLEYVGEDDDWDAQGNNPDFVSKPNGDVVFAFDNHLFGYAYRDQTWRSLVTLNDGFTVVGDSNNGDFDYSLLQTPDRKNIFAFVANEDQTEYHIYRWTSAAGWQLETTYSFDESAELVRANIDKSKSSLDWAFWFDDSETLSVYQWSDDNEYEKRTEKTVDCTGTCTVRLDISKKNKAFVVVMSTSDDSATTAVLAWKPAQAVWEEDSIAVSQAEFDTHVTTNGRWIITYQQTDDSYAIKRWTPDNHWRNAVNLGAEAVYYNTDHIIYVDVAADETMTVNRYRWKNDAGLTLGTVASVETFHDDDSFIYDDHLFAFYNGSQDETVETISL